MSEKMFSSFDIMKVLSSLNLEQKQIVRASNSAVKDEERVSPGDLIIDFADIFNGSYSECNTSANITARLVNDAYNRGRNQVLLEIMSSLVANSEQEQDTASWLEKR